jgi:hypothetical protein
MWMQRILTDIPHETHKIAMRDFRSSSAISESYDPTSQYSQVYNSYDFPWKGQNRPPETSFQKVS